MLFNVKFFLTIDFDFTKCSKFHFPSAVIYFNRIYNFQHTNTFIQYRRIRCKIRQSVRYASRKFHMILILCYCDFIANTLRQLIIRENFPNLMSNRNMDVKDKLRTTMKSGLFKHV